MRLIGSEIAAAAGGIAEKTVTACRPCNVAKGGMPVTLFLKYRHHAHLLMQKRLYWDRIAAKMTEGTPVYDKKTRRDGHPLKIEAVAAFSKPIPEHFVTGTRSIEVRYADAPAPDFVRGQ